MSPEGAPIGVVAGSSVGCWPVPTCSMGSSFSVPCLPQEAFIPLAVLSISICEIRGSCVAVSCFGAVHGRCVTFVQLSLVKVLLLKAFGECAAPVLSVSPAVPALIAMVVCPAITAAHMGGMHDSGDDLEDRGGAHTKSAVPDSGDLGAGKTLGVLRLAALLFFGVSGGPLGTEGLVAAAGPLYSLVGLCILLVLWCFPVGLMTAELGTAFPKDGGYVWWVETAFGTFWGFMMGWISWVSGVVDTAIYPGMFLSFLEKSLQVRWSGVAKQTVLFLFNVVLTGINLVGIDVAGSFSVFFSGVVLMPVAILMLVALPSLQPGAWTQVPAHMDWVRWMNIGIWNTNGFDSISTIGGEIRNPRRTFPLAILLGGALVILPYMLCIMAATGVDQDYASYQNGHYNVIAVREGGWVLGALFTLGTSTAAAGMYLSDLTTYSYQLSGMAEEGMVPSILARKLKGYNTPYMAIALQFLVVMLMSHMDFHDILMCDNCLYCCGLCLELSAMVQLRVSHPDLPRPFRIPAGTAGVAFVMAFPALVCLLVFCTSSAVVLVTSALIIAAGGGIFYLMGSPVSHSYSAL